MKREKASLGAPSTTLAAVTLALLMLLLTIACLGDGDQAAPTSTPTPTPLPAISIYADTALRTNAIAVVDGMIDDREVRAVDSPTDADLAVVMQRPAVGGTPLVVRYWVPVVDLPHPAEELTTAQLQEMVAGRLTTWQTITGQSTQVRLMVPSDIRVPLEQWWNSLQLASQAQVLPAAEIPAAFESSPGTLALLPLEAIDVSMRSLGVDGINIVSGAGDVSTYALTERAWVTIRQTEDVALSHLLGETAPKVATSLTQAPPDPIVLRAAGDFGLVRCTYAKQRDFGDFTRAFSQIGPWLAEADMTIGSSDFSISDAGEPFGCIETFSLLAPPQTVEGYVYAGIDLVTIAANHVKDCGQTGFCGDEPFFNTINNLRNAGIMTVGGGANLAEARKPGILTVKGVRFAFLGYDEIGTHVMAGPSTPGTAPLEEDYLREDIAAAKRQADVVIVMPQWGVEYTADPTLRQRAMAEVAVEAGADLIVGNGAHWVAAAEVIDDAFVAYALGNFVYDQDWSIPTQQGAVLEAIFHGVELKGIRYHPTRILDRHLVTFPGPAEAQQILDQIWDASALLD